MALVKYTGLFPEVELAETGQVVSQGETIDVAADVAARLCLADGWERADTGPLEQRTKTDLLALAEKRGIEGRASMSKDELIAALRGPEGDD